MDRDLRFGEGSPGAGGQAVGWASHRHHHQRNRGEHLVRARRGGRCRSFRRTITSPAMKLKHVKAIIFDWAGTVVDYGSLAPMGAFIETFAEFSVEIAIDEARGPMGMAKRPHIAALVSSPRIAEAWKQKHGHPPTDKDIDALYDVFVPKNISVVADYADVIPGVAEVVSGLRAEGVK